MLCSEQTQRKNLDYQQAATFTYPYIKHMFNVGVDRELPKALTFLQSASETLIWLMPQLLGMQILYMKLIF